MHRCLQMCIYCFPVLNPWNMSTSFYLYVYYDYQYNFKTLSLKRLMDFLRTLKPLWMHFVWFLFLQFMKFLFVIHYSPHFECFPVVVLALRWDPVVPVWDLLHQWASRKQQHRQASLQGRGSTFNSCTGCFCGWVKLMLSICIINRFF